jgi:hypothetical protein
LGKDGFRVKPGMTAEKDNDGGGVFCKNNPFSINPLFSVMQGCRGSKN